MKSKKPSWKQKIHPDISTSIKAFADILKITDNYESNNLEGLLKIIKNSNLKSLKPFYEEDAQQILVEIISIVTNKSLSEAQLEKKFDARIILYLTFCLLDMTSFLVHKKSIKTLYAEAKTGNHESLFKLLQLDKTLFDHEWLKELMLKEMIMANTEFFKRIGNAIKSEPPIGKLKQGKIKLVLLAYWGFGLSKLTIPELMQLLEESGIEVQLDPESFRKFVNRETKSLPKSLSSNL